MGNAAPVPLNLPLGIDRFEKLRRENCYYIDKTNFIRELVRQPFEVSLITRPRRFGKTLTMSMLEDFFDIAKDSRADFQGLNIYHDKEVCTEWMNQWPVIFLTLKSVSGNHFESAYGMLKVLISGLCKKYSFLEKSSCVDKDDRKIFKQLKSQDSSLENIKDCLYTLTRMMYHHYGKPVILLIDEYDVPLAKASDFEYYHEMLDIIRALFDKALKSNEFLKFAVITGCLKIAKESIFTGTNNFVSDTISGGRFDEYIGFTEADTQKLLLDAGFADHKDEVKLWYDGYRFGSVNIYCPWDVLNHVAALARNPSKMPQSYWENTSHNQIIRKFIERKDLWKEEHINDALETLLAGGYITQKIAESLTYDMLHSSADNLWSLLYLTGYLTQAPEPANIDPKSGLTALRIPNEEIRRLFQATIKEWFNDEIKAADRTELFRALWEMDEKACAEILSQMLFDTISYHDYREEYYHAFVTGVLSFAGYSVKSNAESGEGRPDITLKDERNQRAILIEIKRSKTFGEMDHGCANALEQIRNKQYGKELEEEYKEILCYGICFYKKRCRVLGERYR